MRLRNKVVKVAFLCGISLAVCYYYLKANTPNETDHGGKDFVKSHSANLSDLLMWLRLVDSNLAADVGSGKPLKITQLYHVGWPMNNSVKILTKWLVQGTADESSAHENTSKSEATDVDPETLRLMKEAAQKKLADGSPVTAVLVLACDRVTVAPCLLQLLRYRPSEHQFPIIVSHDCANEETAAVISFFSGRGVYRVRQPDQSQIAIPPKKEHLRGYYHVARHYRWLLNLTFETVGFDSAIVVEDDIEVAPDFFEYFAATRKLLDRDSSLWCVSAWNDNGKSYLVDLEAGALIHRTDFFPGLGWMLTRSEWTRLAPGWPRAFWDDWLRRPDQRLGRACLRPEISRTRVCASRGVSRGQFLEEHIGRVFLYDQFVPFTRMSLDHLLKDNYDPLFNATVSGSPVVTKEQLLRRRVPDRGSVRITYRSHADFKLVARTFNLMDDVRSGVPRTAYRGVVTFVYKGVRVYLAPGYNWKGYDDDWK